MRMIKLDTQKRAGEYYSHNSTETVMDYEAIPSLIAMVLEADPQESLCRQRKLSPTAKALRSGRWNKSQTQH